jgi:hypothetical protein
MTNIKIQKEDLPIILKEYNEAIITVVALEKIFKNTGEVFKEIKANVQDFYTSEGLITEDNEGIAFPSGITLKYTKPTELTEGDFVDKVNKAKEALAQAEENLEDFRKHGLVEKTSKPQLRFGTTNKKAKDSILCKELELLKELPALNQIKTKIKEIAE